MDLPQMGKGSILMARTLLGCRSWATRWAVSYIGTTHRPQLTHRPRRTVALLEEPRQVQVGFGLCSRLVSRLVLVKASECLLTYPSNPSRTPWGINAFKNYLDARTRSNPPAEWLQYDSTHLLGGTQAPKGSLHILVDSGSADDFGKKGQLEPERLKEAAEHAGREEGEVQVRIQDGFDHSYYFVSVVL
jgi:hypothetical protein